MHSQPWDVSEVSDENMGTILADVVGLVEVAEYLGCVRAILKGVDAKMMGQDQVLYQ